MKKIIVLCSFGLFFYSCQSVPHNYKGQTYNSVNQNTELNNLNREDIKVTANVEGTKNFTKIWFLFIPFGKSGQQGEDFRREKVYLNTCRSRNIDGILQPKFETKKIVIPLIAFTYVGYKTTVVGRGYNIRVDTK